ncbi:MAG: 50S ribosomal protein L9 [SAR86 cluster bacterium]|uniref:Large ribosomal subunit protein bL9 n=1 Tax=SAR86 cluster bacterium TaxID=2030880 RepID=A0A2A4MRR0_9GAMM|nr:MAG: 50S ribosomal protein L9 [SAR86 cluster bacterium]
MNIILLEKLGKLGSVGDTASVKAGYARNYLFPFGKAIPATKKNLVDFEGRRAELLAAHDSNVAASQKRAKPVDGLKLHIDANASDEGKLFGSVGTKDIADAINAAVKGGDISKKEIQLPNGVIRELGEYEVTIDFGYEVTGTVTVLVAQLESAGVSADGIVAEAFEEPAADEETAAEPSAE